MKKIEPEGTKSSSEIWKLVSDTLEEISDESGDEDLGEGYLLKYEGWSGVCVEEMWMEVEAKQERKKTATRFLLPGR